MNQSLYARPGTRIRLNLWREVLLFVVLVLLGMGLVVGWGLDAALAKGPLLPVLSRRALPMFLGLGLFFTMQLIPLDWIKKGAPYVLGLAIVLCILPKFFGWSGKGAARWIPVGGITFQPVEILKPALVLSFASLLVAFGRGIEKGFSEILQSVGFLGLASLVLIMQPDIGNAFFIFVVGGVMLVAAGLSLRAILILLSMLGLGVFLLLTLGFHHTQARLADFFSATPGYQMSRGLSAFSEGGLAGTGIGESWSKFFIPEGRNDFVLAVLGNEFGVLGSLLVVGLFTLFLYAGIQIARRKRDPWASLVALGLVVQIVGQACFNMLGVTYTIPEKGIDLPFISSGGTGLVFALATVGLLARIATPEEGRALD